MVQNKVRTKFLTREQRRNLKPNTSSSVSQNPFNVRTKKDI